MYLKFSKSVFNIASYSIELLNSVLLDTDFAGISTCVNYSSYILPRQPWPQLCPSFALLDITHSSFNETPVNS